MQFFNAIFNQINFFWTYIQYSIVPLPLLNIRVLHPASEIVDHHELQEAGVDEAHADRVPQVHGCEVGHNRQVRAESIRSGEEIQHRGDTWRQ